MLEINGLLAMHTLPLCNFLGPFHLDLWRLDRSSVGLHQRSWAYWEGQRLSFPSTERWWGWRGELQQEIRRWGWWLVDLGSISGNHGFGRWLSLLSMMH